MTADIRPIRTTAESGLIAAFEAARDRLPGDPAPREAAFGTIAQGLPHRRVEEWKYTDLRAIMREAKPLASPPDAADLGRVAAAGLPLPDVDAARLVLVNGAFAPELSDLGGLPAGVEVAPLGKALSEGHRLLAELGRAGAPADNAAVALVTAFVSDGALIRVPAGLKLDRPIHVVMAQTGEGHAAYARVLLVVEDGAEAMLIESHVGPGADQTASLVEILAADRAVVRHVKLQAESLGTLHLATLAARLGTETELSSLAVVRGAAAARQQVYVSFDGERAKAALRGVTLAGGRRHLDTTLLVDHVRPGGESREQYKAVLDGRARSVFQGKIVVRREAQKTDGRMMSQALMLSEDAETDLKPELEIYADDVLCAHGATSGQLDGDLLFYLMTRGIPQPEAEAILVEAFVGEVLDTVEDEPLRQALAAEAAVWLRERV